MNPTTFNPSITGTQGLPVFGDHAIVKGREAALKEVEGAFNNLIATVKKYMIAGNEASLHNFCLSIEQSWGPAYKTVAGKGTVGN